MSGGRGVLRRCAVACVAALALGAAGLAGPAAGNATAAARSTYVEGAGAAGFSLDKPLGPGVSLVSGASGQSLGMKVGELASYGASAPAYVGLGVTSPDPRSVEAIAGGGVLIADAANKLVLRVDDAGQVVWAYTASADPALQEPVCAHRAGSGRYLIVDRAASRVFIADVSGAVVWQYGTTGEAGSGVNQLSAPTHAEQLPSGDVAICDAGNHRVIVVRASDYSAEAPELGYSAASIVWQYGTTGVSGSDVDQLVLPTSTRWLTNGANSGNVLICDEGAAQVIEVRTADYDAAAEHHGFNDASLVWHYPAEDGEGVRPSFAVGASGGDGIVWIADASGGEILGVATGSAAGSPTRHDVVARYGAGRPAFAGSLTAPCALSLTDDGAIAVADPGADRVSVVGTTAATAVVTSLPLTCGRAGRKLFVSVTCAFVAVPSASIGVSIRVDGGEWTFLQGSLGGAADGTGAVASGTLLLPRLSVGREIEYMLTMANTYRSFAPTLVSLTITYEPRGNGSGSGGGGESGDNQRSNGSGSYSYPGSGGGSGQGSGGGEGGGSGSGSGAGSGQGFGSGSSASTMGAETGSSAASSSGADLPTSLDPAATVPGSETTVSGYRMKASGVAGGGEGGGSSVVQASTATGWVLIPASLGFLGLAVMSGAVLAERRRIRAYTEYDPKRPRALPAEAGVPTPRPLLPPPLVRPGGPR